MSRSNEHASSKTLENRADAKRSEISETLDKLEQKVSPDQLMDQAMSLAREHGGGIARNLSAVARDNPLPLVLTGVGLAWLMASQSNGSSHRYERYGDYREWDDDPEWDEGVDEVHVTGSSHRLARGSALYSSGNAGMANSDSEASESAAMSNDDDDDSLIDKARDKAGELSDTIDQKRRQAARRARAAQADARARADHWRARGRRQANDLGEQAQNATQQVQNYFQQEPMVAGALGIALGALIGSLMPSTDLEDRHLGERSDEITDQVKQQADSAVKQSREKIEEAAKSAKETASEKMEAERQETASTVA